MHEAAIAESLAEQVLGFAPAGTRVRQVRVEIGALEHIDSSVLAAAWAARIAGTELVASELEQRRVALRVRCRSCGSESEPEDPAILSCAVCGAVRPVVVEGSGILLRSLEVEEVP